MPRNISPRPSIAEIGLDTYLNNTACLHNDYDYKDFVKFVESGMSISSIAHIMKVTRPTIYSYRRHYKNMSKLK